MFVCTVYSAVMYFCRISSEFNNACKIYCRGGFITALYLLSY